MPFRGTTLEAYLEPSRRSTTGHFCKNNQRLEAFNNFPKNASLQMFDRVLNTPLGFKKLEAVAQRCYVKKVLLETLPISQENTCARVSFLTKLQA